MRKMKVLSLLILCFMMVFIAACGGGGDSTEENPPAAEGEGTEPAAEEQPATEEQSAEEVAEEPPVDLGGRTIRISAWWDLTPAGDSVGAKARRDKIAELEKKYNMKIEFVNVPWGEYPDKFTTTVLAGEPFADIVRMEYNWALPAILNDQLLPLSEFTTATSDVNNENKYFVKLKPLAGGEYGFIQPGVGGIGVHYNRDIFQKLGLPDPQQLYNNGEWTWEKFLEIAKQATKDTDNDGNTDVWGLAGWVHMIVRNFAAANGAKIVDDATGTEGMTDPKFIETLEFVNRLYNVEKVVQNKTGNILAYEEIDTYKDGKAAMWLAADWMIPQAEGDTALPFDYGVVPVPQGPNGSNEYKWNDNYGHGYFIPKGVKDPQIVYQIFEEMEMIPPTEDWPGQEYFEAKYKHEEDIMMYREHIGGKGLISLDGAYPNFPFGKVIDEVIGNKASPSATVEKFKLEAQDAINSLGKK